MDASYLDNKKLDWHRASKENDGKRTEEKNGMKELEKDQITIVTEGIKDTR